MAKEKQQQEKMDTQAMMEVYKRHRRHRIRQPYQEVFVDLDGYHEHSYPAF